MLLRQSPRWCLCRRPHRCRRHNPRMSQRRLQQSHQHLCPRMCLLLDQLRGLLSCLRRNRRITQHWFLLLCLRHCLRLNLRHRLLLSLPSIQGHRAQYRPIYLYQRLQDTQLYSRRRYQCHSPHLSRPHILLLYLPLCQLMHQLRHLPTTQLSSQLHRLRTRRLLSLRLHRTLSLHHSPLMHLLRSLR
jgi:hypothetical protein